jgi:hypothetical protein
MTMTTTEMQITTKTLLQHLKIYSIIIGIIAIVFWIWAIINTIQNQIIDGGIISFLTVIISNIYIFYLTLTLTTTTTTTRSNNNQNQNNNDRRRSLQLQSICTSWCVVGSHMFVTLNYLGGIIVSLYIASIGQVIYCIIFTILWMIFSYLIWWLLKQYRLSTTTTTTTSSSDDNGNDNDNV